MGKGLRCIYRAQRYTAGQFTAHFRKLEGFTGCDGAACPLSPMSIKNITQVVKLVKASAVDENGDELYPTKWNHEFIDMPVVDGTKQRRPAFTSEQVEKIVKATTGRLQMAATLLAATGIRSGELLGLEVCHFDGNSVRIEQSLWKGKVGEPKTPNARRSVDVHPDVAELPRQYIGGRTKGFIFQTKNRYPMNQRNLARALYKALEKLKIPQCGFHSFRRYRNTFLRNLICPDGLLKFWMGHAAKDMSDRYDRVREDVHSGVMQRSRLALVSSYRRPSPQCARRQSRKCIRALLGVTRKRK